MLTFAGRLVRRTYIDGHISQRIRSQRIQFLIVFCVLNKFLQSFILTLLFFDILLKLYSVHSELFLFRFIVSTHHRKTLVRQFSFGIVLINLHEQSVQLSNTFFSLCQLLSPCLYLFITFYFLLFLHNCTEVIFIVENIADDSFHVHPHHILQNDCTDIVEFAFFIVLTMSGTLEEILSLLKIVSCAVI